jgi:hypothetical protein
MRQDLAYDIDDILTCIGKDMHATKKKKTCIYILPSTFESPYTTLRAGTFFLSVKNNTWDMQACFEKVNKKLARDIYSTKKI